MEVGNVQNIVTQKADKAGEAAKARQAAVNAYARAERKEDGDTVAVSSKAKLLHSLREKYEDLPEDTRKVENLKEKIQEGTHKLSAEEIVKGILQGSLFEII